MRFGIVDPEGSRVPRYVMTPQGPIPLSTIIAESTIIDPETQAPAPGATSPNSIDPAALAQGSHADLSKRAIEAPRASTAIALPERTPTQLAELATFGRFAKARVKAGDWRDFEFKSIDRVTGHRLNVAEFSDMRKAAGELVAAGLAVLALDTGRVLMLQRALESGDPNGGLWEFPGGHIEPDELPEDAARREWSEEVAVPCPNGQDAGPGWLSPNGRYGGFVMVVPDESCVTPHARGDGLINPDDPDGDAVEAVAWWLPSQLVNNPAVRPELAADMSLVLGAINAAQRAPVAEQMLAVVVSTFDKLAAGDDASSHGEGGVAG